ncbi:MAG: aldo/keto reductase [Chromatiales bacterium]|nr:aldo/keto reductase [Chromatiales bacterium]
MEYRSLGRSGLSVSAVGLGCMNFGMMNDADESAAIVARALELGVNFFDTADVYGQRGRSEEFLGRALGPRRSEVVIATKFAGPMSSTQDWMQGGSRRWIMQAVEGSLRRLGTDWIDLYQMHRADTVVPIEESLRALDDLVRQGKVRYIGNSNYAAWQLVDADWTARQCQLNRFVSAQNRHSLLSRDAERELVPALEACGLGLLPYFPLESGMLTGKYRPGEPPPEGSRLAKWGSWGSGAFASEDKQSQVRQLDALCAEHGCTLLELAMGWLAGRRYVGSVIAGVTSIAQLEANVAAGAFRPGPELLAAVDKVSPPPPVPMGPR